MLYRSLTTGLLAACLIMLVHRSEPVRQLVRSRPIPQARPPIDRSTATVSIVDVAPNIRGEALSNLVHLRSGEHVIEVNDRPVTTDLEAGAAIAWPTISSYVDITVAGGPAPRRVLLLMH